MTWEPSPDDAELIYANFYKCPNTGEWVYKWTNERFVLVRHDTHPTPPEDVEEPMCVTCEGMGTIKAFDQRQAEPCPDCTPENVETQTCPNCHGWGHEEWGPVECHVCEGSGRTPENVECSTCDGFREVFASRDVERPELDRWYACPDCTTPENVEEL